MPAHRTSAVLKILNGSASVNSARVRDDAKATPTARLDGPPPHVRLSVKERRVFDWFVANGAMPAVHRSTDAALLCALARCSVALEVAHAKVLADGMVIRSSASGLPRINPHAYAERKLTDEMRGLLNELGMTPAGRLRCAPAMTDRTSPDAAEWDAIAR
jgi:hypothetical protein